MPHSPDFLENALELKARGLLRPRDDEVYIRNSGIGERVTGEEDEPGGRPITYGEMRKRVLDLIRTSGKPQNLINNIGFLLRLEGIPEDEVQEFENYMRVSNDPTGQYAGLVPGTPLTITPLVENVLEQYGLRGYVRNRGPILYTGPDTSPAAQAAYLASQRAARASRAPTTFRGEVGPGGVVLPGQQTNIINPQLQPNLRPARRVSLPPLQLSRPGVQETITFPAPRTGAATIQSAAPLQNPALRRVAFDRYRMPLIPRLARGGVVTGPTLAFLGERGPEAVIPLRRGARRRLNEVISGSEGAGPEEPAGPEEEGPEGPNIPITQVQLPDGRILTLIRQFAGEVDLNGNPIYKWVPIGSPYRPPVAATGGGGGGGGRVVFPFEQAFTEARTQEILDGILIARQRQALAEQAQNFEESFKWANFEAALKQQAKEFGLKERELEERVKDRAYQRELDRLNQQFQRAQLELARQRLGLEAELGYAASRRADYGLQLEEAGLTGTYGGRPTLQARTQLAALTGEIDGRPTLQRSQFLANYDASRRAESIAREQQEREDALRAAQFNRALVADPSRIPIRRFRPVTLPGVAQ